MGESWASSAGVRASMQANKGRDTKPEVALRSAVHAFGLRYRVSTRPLKGLRRTADLVFPRARVAVFLDGCFWHGCEIHGTTPKSNVEYWGPKLAANRERDRRVDEELTAHGWLVLRCWEHDQPEDFADQVSLQIRLRIEEDA